MTGTVELHRRYTLTVKIGADSYQDLIRSLDDLSYMLDLHGEEPKESWNAASGSPVAGYSYEVGFDPDMDHDRYIAQIEARTGVG